MPTAETLRALTIITALVAVTTAAPARAAMEPEEIIIRLATCMKLPPGYRAWCRPKHPVYRIRKNNSKAA